MHTKNKSTNLDKIKHGSLFTGFGGFDLAAEWMGWENIFHVEWMDFPRRVVDYYWPNADSYEDIKTTDFKPYRGRIDILTGGFPCQPFSHAGKREGANDDRYLWPEMLRCIKECRPTWVIAENVDGLSTMVFDPKQTNLESQATIEGQEIRLSMEGDGVLLRITEELEDAGYSVQSIIVPACGVNAPHKRNRVWIIAHSNDDGEVRGPGENEGKSKTQRVSKRDQVQQFNESNNVRGFSSDSNSSRLQEKRAKQSTTRATGKDSSCNATHTNDTRNRIDELQNDEGRKKGNKRREKQSFVKPGEISSDRYATNTSSLRGEQNNREGESKLSDQSYPGGDWASFPTQPPVCGRDDGLPRELDGVTFPKWREESIKGYGNAIVPQVAYEFFLAIEQIWHKS